MLIYIVEDRSSSGDYGSSECKSGGTRHLFFCCYFCVKDCKYVPMWRAPTSEVAISCNSILDSIFFPFILCDFQV